MSTPVALNRRFIPWTDKNSRDLEVLTSLSAFRDALTWEDLLARHRVVILAEAGSGKSTELAEQARLSSAAGRYTFSTTVQNVGRRGLSSALGRIMSRKLEEWRSSEEPAWFFFDSVDEAKASDVRLDDALKEIADGIEGGASRAHVVLSGRHTDWEFRRDLERLNAWIGMPPADVIAPAIDPNELIVSIIRQDKLPEPPPPSEAPLVVVMGALDRSQVEAFARGKGVDNVDALFDELSRANLWDFARRPLDLDWLVGYWQTRGALGPLADILALSLRERLGEPDLQRARTDPIDVDRAMAASQRIGAALVLQRLEDVAVPDSGLDLAAGRPVLDLADILPDWSGEDRTRLINRGIFDPASAGFARLHNDNEGSVRSFLAARWLKRLTDENCPKAEVDALLFATTYRVPLVIPSMRQTAAWLSIWNTDVARKVVERDPRLLMDAGDPASLPLVMRERVLEAVVEQVIDDDELDIPDRDSLRRFAMPDMAPCVRELWRAHSNSPAVRELLLLMIWLGKLTPCADLACAASFGSHGDRYSQIFSGRALMATASDAEKRRYAAYVMDNAGSLSSVVVWDAVEALFPTILGVDDFLRILNSIDVTDRSGGLGLELLGPKLAEQLKSAAQSERLIAGLLDRLGARLKPVHEQELPEDEPILPTLEAVGRRLLELVLPTDAPPLAIDAALRLDEDRHYKPWRRRKEEAADIFSLLKRTPERRRAALWRAVERLSGATILQGDPITHVWQLEIAGFSLDLKAADFDWLLEDAEHRPAPSERQIAINAALKLWREAGAHSDQFARIEVIGRIHPEVAAAIDDWTRPRSISEEQRASERRLHLMNRRNALNSAKSEQSWCEFADRLRAEPNQLRDIKPPTEKGVDARLYRLWQFLNSLGSNQSRYAIDDLTPLEPMFGASVVAALRDAFVAYWRHWSPTLRSEQAKDKRDTISALDCIGIVGVTLEAAARPTWAAELSYDDAVRAAIYATLELNGFPAWLVSLAQAQPDAVRQVLKRSVGPELNGSGNASRREALEDISQADIAISSLLADEMFDYLRRNEDLPAAVLRPILRILQAGYKDSAALASLLRERFDLATIVEQEAIYLASLLKLDVIQATGALEAKLAASPFDRQVPLVQAVFPTVFGGFWDYGTVRPGEVPFECLEHLVLIAFRTIRLEEDNYRSDGKVFSPDTRDDAEGARGALFKALIDTPGLATFDAIHRFMEMPGFPVQRRRMREFARNRAGIDSEAGVWSSADVYAFESDFVTAPRNPPDLQKLALRRLANLQYDLLNADYAQGATVASLPNEVDVQNWMADRLRRDQGRSYSIEREPHVVEEKEPDIRFRAKASDANVPMEIKVAESWSLNQLEDALKVQLVGRYLRDRHNRHGILLLVHQKARPRGWPAATGEVLVFKQMVDHLEILARSIAAETSNAPQVEIAVINVSSLIARAKKPRGTKSVAGKPLIAKDGRRDDHRARS